LEAIRDGTLELYRDPLLIEDLYGARIVEKSYGHKVELTENENGHGDRLAAMLNVLPFMLEGLGQPLAPVTPEDMTPFFECFV
jgi:hypothetical protein